jgi:hypothetical protein
MKIKKIYTTNGIKVRQELIAYSTVKIKKTEKEKTKNII